jgi:hypothetical protein
MFTLCEQHARHVDDHPSSTVLPLGDRQIP